MSQGFDPAALQAAYRQVEEGDPRMRAIRQAIAEAEQAQDFHAQIVFHRDLIKESVFTGDRYQALIDFPQYYALYENHEELRDVHRYNVIWTFKWILEAATEFPQIPKNQIVQWFSQFRKELRCAGYSLQPFYNLRTQFYSYFDMARMRMDYEEFLNAPTDDMSDGESNIYDNRVQWELRFGQREKAEKSLQYIIDHNFRTEECPAKPYGFFLQESMRKQETENAEKYAKMLVPLCNGKRFRMEQSGLLMCFYALYHPQDGWDYLQKNADARENSRNPYLCFWFDRGVYLLCKALGKQGMTVKDKKGRTFSPQELLDHAEQTRKSCTEIAAQFDARNESTYFADALAEYDNLL